MNSVFDSLPIIPHEKRLGGELLRLPDRPHASRAKRISCPSYAALQISHEDAGRDQLRINSWPISPLHVIVSKNSSRTFSVT
jgi:hypothetical protein